MPKNPLRRFSKSVKPDSGQDDPESRMLKGPSQAANTEITPTPAKAGNAIHNKLATFKNLFHHHEKRIQISPAGDALPALAQLARAIPVQGSLATGQIDEPVAHDEEKMALVPGAVQSDAGLVGETDSSPKLEDISATSLESLKKFITAVSTKIDVPPYARVLLEVLTSAAQLVITQAKVDAAVSGLLPILQQVYEFLRNDQILTKFDTRKETLACITHVVNDSTQFIKNYADVKSSWKRLGKDIASETQAAIDGYNQALDTLMKQYHDRKAQDGPVKFAPVLRGLQDTRLEGMLYVKETILDSRIRCMDGTRKDVLQDIVRWIHDPDVNTPRVFWLHGLAGQGKSAIIHTIAQWLENVGKLTTYFCFAGDRQIDRRQDKIFTTIARDLADYDPSFRHVLVDTVTRYPSLKTTRDVMQQWEKLLLEPISKVADGAMKNVVIIIDGLDESGPSSSRMHILAALASKEAASLPPNFRILLASRPLDDIQRALGSSPHVKVLSLNGFSTEDMEKELRHYISNQISKYSGIEPHEVKQMAEISKGLYEVARLSCYYLNPHVPGMSAKERLVDMVELVRGEGEPLLDTIYSATLDAIIGPRPLPRERFCSVMRQVIYTYEPLSMEAFTKMRRHFAQEADQYDSNIIISFMSIVLTAVKLRTTSVRPMNASFYEFLASASRSGKYFSGDPSIQADLALSSLRVLRDDLRFNICQLENSYILNSEVEDLAVKVKSCIPLHLEYTCKYWIKHLMTTQFTPSLAEQVRDLLGSEKVLFWLEVLSFVGGLDNAAIDLASLGRWLQEKKGYEDLVALARDCVKFIQNFAGAISSSTPHLYISALPLAPESSVLCKALRPKFSQLAKAAVGQLQEWPDAQVLLQGHDGTVTSVAFSPDGTKVVSGSNDMSVRVWDAESCVPIGSPLHGHSGYVQSVAFSPDGTRVVTGSFDTTLIVWDVKRGVQIGSPFQGHSEPVNSVAFSPDGTRIVSGSRDNTLRVWDTEKGVQIGSPLQGHTHYVQSAAFSPDGTRIVSGSYDKTVRVWDVEGGGQVGKSLEGHSNQVQSVAFSPDGSRIVSGSSDGTVRIWDAEKGVQIGRPLAGHTHSVQSVSFSPDGTRIVSGSYDNTIRVWDTEGTQIGRSLEGHTHWVQSIAISPDGKKIVSGSSDKSVRIWKGDCVNVSNQSLGHNDYIQSVAFSPDGARIATSSGDQTVRIWDAKSRVQIGNSLHGHSHWVQSIAFSPDGKKIVSCSSDKTIRVWDANTGVQIGDPFHGHTGAVNSVAYSFNGKKIVSGSDDHTIRVWNPKKGSQSGKPLIGHAAPVQSVAFSSDGKRIVSGSNDKTVRIWDRKKGAQIGTPLQGHTDIVQSVAFSPNGLRIVSASWDKTVRIWDVKTQAQIGHTLEGHTGMVLSTVFSPDGTKIVSGSSDNTVRIWDSVACAQIGCPLEGHDGWVKSVSFSADGAEIVSGSYDMTVRIWDAKGYVQFCKNYDPGHPICFSPVASHFLQDGETLLDATFDDEKGLHQNVRLHKDGWIRGSHGQLLLWIPPTMWQPFYDMWTKVVIPRGGVELDLSQMVHGEHWNECFIPAE